MLKLAMRNIARQRAAKIRDGSRRRVDGIEAQHPRVRALRAQELAPHRKRQAYGSVVERLDESIEYPHDRSLGAIDGAAREAYEETDDVTELHAERSRQAASEQHAARIRRGQRVALQREPLADPPVGLGIDGLAGKRDGGAAVRHEAAHRKALIERLHAGRRPCRSQVFWIGGKQIGAGVREPRIAEARTRDVHVTEAGLDRRLAHRPEDPFDESARDEQCGDAEGDRGQRDQRARTMAREVPRRERQR